MLTATNLLQFVQCLSNPFYLSYLAHTKVLDDPRFVQYLEYLEYFRKPDYAQLLTCDPTLVCRPSADRATPSYPVYSLAALTLLQRPQFRIDIANPALAQEMMQDMVASFLPASAPAAAVPAIKENGDANGTST